MALEYARPREKIAIDGYTYAEVRSYIVGGSNVWMRRKSWPIGCYLWLDNHGIHIMTTPERSGILYQVTKEDKTANDWIIHL